MPFVHDGTEQYGNATAYWLRNDETGERIPVQDPLLAEQVAGPLPPPGERFNWKPAPTPAPQVGAGTSATSGLKWTTPEGERDPKRDTPMGKLREATAPDRRQANLGGYMDALDQRGETPAESAGAHAERSPVAAPAEPIHARDQVDESGLVYMDQDSGGEPGQMRLDAPNAGGQSPYFSQTPVRMPGLEVDPRMFRSAPRAAGWVAASKKEKGDPNTVADLRDRAVKVLDYQVETALAERDIKQSQLEQRRADAELMQTRNLSEQQRLQGEVATKERAKRERLVGLDRQARDLASKKVDPNRWYTNAGPGGVILAAVARAAGTFGGTDDPGRLIDAFIAADIAQQEDEYRSARETLDVNRNAFAREMQEGADPEIARKKIEYLQNEYAKSIIEDRDTREALQLLGVNADQLIAERAEKSLKLRADFEALLGQELDSKFRQASGGGFDMMRYLQAREQAAKTSQAEGEAYGVFPTQAERLETQKQFAAGGKQTKEFQGQVERLGDKMSTGGVSMGDLMMARDQFEDTIRGLAEANGQDIPGTGSISGLLPNLLAGEDGRKVRREAGRLTNFFLKRLSGAASPDAEVIKQMEQDLAVYSDMAASDEEVAAALESTSALIDSMAATRAAGFPPEVYGGWRDNLSRIRRDYAGSADLLGRGSTFEED